MPPRHGRSDNDPAVTQSLLDRLLDNEPSAPSDGAVSRAESVRRLKASVRRDLEWLLNTRRTPDPAPESMPELSRSLFNYGLPDFSSLSVTSPRDRDHLLLELENTVAIFEPRLKDVRVSLIDAPQGYTRILRFQIEGMLDMNPMAERISFDTLLQLNSGEYQIRGDGSAG
jgi:type VI secretion system protein ImpF